MSCPTIILMGVCGAGKSHVGRLLAEELGAVFEDADYHHLPQTRAKLAAGFALTDEDRRPWYQVLRQRILAVRGGGQRLVMACSALHEVLRAWLRGDDSPEALCFVLLESPREVIEARMKTRVGHFMPSSLIDSQFATLQVTPDILRVPNDRDPHTVARSIYTLVTHS